MIFSQHQMRFILSSTGNFRAVVVVVQHISMVLVNPPTAKSILCCLPTPRIVKSRGESLEDNARVVGQFDSMVMVLGTNQTREFELHATTIEMLDYI